MKKLIILILVLGAMILVACEAEEVEVTRVVTETEVVTETITEEIEVTRIVEGESVTEIQEVEVEVTRIVEVAVEETDDALACNMEAPAEATIINFLGWTYPIADFYADEIKECDAIENLSVNKQILGNDEVRQQLYLTLSGGAVSPYDIVHMATQNIPGFVDVGMLMPLNDLIDKYGDQYDLDDISDASYFGAEIDGNIYGIPSGGNTKHLVYRSDLFEQYGLEVPTTYDEVIAACEVLADEPSIDIPFTINLHAGWAWELQFRNFARAFGMPALVNDDNTPGFNSPEGVAAAELMVKVIDACMGDEGLTYSIDDSEIALENGSLAFAHIWASRGAVMHDPEKTDIADLLAFAPAPTAIDGGLLVAGSWSDYYGIPAMTKIDPEIAFQVIMEALDLESQEGASEFGLPARASVVGGPANTEAAAASVAGGVGSYGKNPGIALAKNSLIKFLPLIGTGEMTPQEALDAAAEDYITEATAQGYLP
jgi:multiple sugar transport system substrate-binding protein